MSNLEKLPLFFSEVSLRNSVEQSNSFLKTSEGTRRSRLVPQGQIGADDDDAIPSLAAILDSFSRSDERLLSLLPPAYHFDRKSRSQFVFLVPQFDH